MTLRYARMALDNWEWVDGYAAGHNMGALEELPIDRFCNFMWWWATRNMEDEQDVEKLRGDLWQPPPNYDKPITKGPWSPEEETSAFAALKTALGQ